MLPRHEEPDGIERIFWPRFFWRGRIGGAINKASETDHRPDTAGLRHLEREFAQHHVFDHTLAQRTGKFFTGLWVCF